MMDVFCSADSSNNLKIQHSFPTRRSSDLDFSEHLTTLRGMGAQGVDVRRPEQLDDIDGLIIPGGESTTIGKLAQSYGIRSEEHTSELQSHHDLVCRLLLEKKKPS